MAVNSFRPFGCNIHAHSDAGSLDGASSVKSIVKRAKELGYGHFVLTEHGTLSSAAALGMSASEEKLSFSHGIEAYLDTPYERLGLDPVEQASSGARVYSHITILFKTQKAYLYFCRLTPIMESRALVRFGERKPLIKWEEIEEIGSDIILGTGCIDSMINRFARNQQYNIAEKAYLMYKQAVQPGCLFLEIFPHQVTHNWKKPIYDKSDKLVSRGQFIENPNLPGLNHNDLQRVCNEFIFSMHAKYNDLTVVSEDSHFALSKQKITQDCKLSNGDEGWKFHSSYHMRSSDELFEMLNAYHGVSVEQMDQMIDNSYILKEQLSGYTFLTSKDRWVLPVYDGDSKRHLVELIKKHGRMKNTLEYIQRLKYETSVLADNGKIDFLSYFFIVEDVSDWCKKNNVLMNLRGSAGGSLILYLIGASITDPLRYGIPFERFLTLDRIVKANTPPDADLDFSSKEIVVKYLKDKYGDKIAALSINTNMKLKNSIKDAERAVLGSVRKETEIMCYTFPGIPQGPTEQQWLYGYEDKETGEHIDGFWEQSDILRQYAALNPEVWSIVDECLGVMRNKGSHSCGFIITPEPVHYSFPILWVGKKDSGQICTAFDPKTLEWAGGIKYDFLGVKTLDTIRRTTDLIRDRHGIDLEWREYDHSDEVYERIFHTGDTLGTFQFSTPTVVPFIKKIKPRSIQDLSAITALCRPGTLQAPAPDGSNRTCAEYYVSIAQGEQPYYIHPDMEPILKDTNSVILFQEQFLKTLVYSGLTLAEAEAGRRAVSKKKKEDLQRIIGGMKVRLLDKGWTQSQVDMLGDQLIASNRYSFNFSHACISRDQGIRTADGIFKIEDLYNLLELPELHCVDESGNVIKEKPAEVILSGLKEVFEVEFEDGSIIKLTSDHKVWYNKGWVSLKQAIDDGGEWSLLDEDTFFMPVRS